LCGLDGIFNYYHYFLPTERAYVSTDSHNTQRSFPYGSDRLVFVLEKGRGFKMWQMGQIFGSRTATF